MYCTVLYCKQCKLRRAIVNRDPSEIIVAAAIRGTVLYCIPRLEGFSLLQPSTPSSRVHMRKSSLCSPSSAWWRCSSRLLVVRARRIVQRLTLDCSTRVVRKTARTRGEIRRSVKRYSKLQCIVVFRESRINVILPRSTCAVWSLLV